MKPVIDFDECLRDSPKFREQLENEEANIDVLEQKLDKVLKTCSLMIESGKTYMTHRGNFTNALWDLTANFSEDPPVMAALNRIIHSLQEMNKFHSILLDQASRTVLKNLSAFIKVDIKGVKESKHYFEKISNDLDLALNRNSQVSRNKQNEVEEVVNLLSATRSCFRHTALDYVHIITMLQARKRHEILATITILYHSSSCHMFKHVAHTTIKVQIYLRTWNPFLSLWPMMYQKMRSDTKILDKEMENRHTVVNSRDTVLPSCKTDNDADGKDGLLTTPVLKNLPRMQGYLFKRTSNAFKTWNRRWFYLYDNRLVYRKRTGELNVTVMEEDLRLCTVKPVLDGERRFCFEVLSPSKLVTSKPGHTFDCSPDPTSVFDPSSVLRFGPGPARDSVPIRFYSCPVRNSLPYPASNSDCATSHNSDLGEAGNSEEMLTCWIAALQNGIRSAIQQGRDHHETRAHCDTNADSRPQPIAFRKVRIWEQLLNIPGNNYCCDCGAANPRWASINLGITLCIVIVAPLACGLQEMINKMYDFVKKRDMKVNVGKSKVMVFERDESTTDCDILIEAKASHEKRVWLSTIPTLIYGSESRVWQKKNGSQINAVEMRALRSMCGVSQKDKCKNSDVKQRCGLNVDVVTRVEKECSGIHRSLGVHHSKVRSLTLDDWEPEVIKVMAELGNSIVNKIYEANAGGTSITRATPDCDTSRVGCVRPLSLFYSDASADGVEERSLVPRSRSHTRLRRNVTMSHAFSSVRETWIRAKYVSLLFVKELVGGAAIESPQRDRRRWSVRRTRRRCVRRASPSIPDTISDVNSNTSASEPDKSSTESPVLIIGKDLTSERIIDLSLPSDQDSTEGEEADEVDDISEDMSSLSPQAVLFRAAEAHNLPVMMAALAGGAEVNHVYSTHKRRTPLHAAVLSGSVMACSYLLVNGSKFNIQDEDGKTPLHLATEAGHTGQVCLLLRYRADQSISDRDGQTPLDIAVNHANADIVTLLRLTKLNDEMKESEMSSNDDTYNEVFRDYTQLAHSHPERLVRKNTLQNNNEVERRLSERRLTERQWLGRVYTPVPRVPRLRPPRCSFRALVAIRSLVIVLARQAHIQIYTMTTLVYGSSDTAIVFSVIYSTTHKTIAQNCLRMMQWARITIPNPSYFSPAHGGVFVTKSWPKLFLMV
ncbi:Arf-GAP with coiled-coil, ANK repeat and PH domain-containing protein 2 [Eumeta japonica]|uniref:Arf-GAP with coiled-coil, ANK repeat and PH domain-containing protein 2 n=1 Tax=Eumeta variegata TaxID=151549 RepID=A0A4C1W841_EUMVA|nr:Arf-GAP with coiled-coil, ANK repeat and PH domain-containing protein 2 [Eumeta japonica]